MAGKTPNGKSMRITGSVASGLGEGRYFMSLQWYAERMTQVLHYRPFAGTLNIKLRGSELHKMEELEKYTGIRIPGFEHEGKRFGGVTVYRAMLSGTDCAVVVPDLSRHNDIIEVVAGACLRKSMGLEDGSAVTLTVYCES